jgi:hypothetical protein
MTFHQKLFAIIVSVGLLAVILEMVRRRKIKEEYSWLWLLVVVVMIILVVWHNLLLSLTYLIGAVNPLTTLILLGFIFLILINIDYSVRISAYKDQIKKLAQKTGIISKEIENLKNRK